MSLDRWPVQFSASADLLRRAAFYAESLRLSPWDFAVEIDELMNQGMSKADLRWVVYHGLLEHAEEVTTFPCNHREFQPSPMLTFSVRTCFILTQIGHAAITDLAKQEASAVIKKTKANYGFDTHQPRAISKMSDSSLTPNWNPETNRLLLGNMLVKHFRRPAPNQQLILTVFQEENWPRRIDDPLPRTIAIEPKRRLHEAIASLNSNQQNRVLHFAGDGFGNGICWLPLVGKPAFSG